MYIFKISYNGQWYIVGAENIQDAEDRFFEFTGISDTNTKLTIEEVSEDTDLSKDDSIQI